MTIQTEYKKVLSETIEQVHNNELMTTKELYKKLIHELKDQYPSKVLQELLKP